MTFVRQLVELLTPSFAGTPDRLEVRADVSGCYIGRAPNGRVCLIVPTLREAHVRIGRVSGAISTSFVPLVHLEVRGHAWTTASALIECSDELLLPAFAALATELAERLTSGGRTPSCADVAQALGDWERLLRHRTVLSEEAQLGLWGELTLIAQAPDMDGAVLAWHVSQDKTLDFFANGIGLECKSSRQRLRHYVSHSQIVRSSASGETYFVSLWVDVDPFKGTSIADVVAVLRSRTTQSVVLEKVLLTLGYSPREVESYKSRFVLLEDPLWFPADVVPKVHSMDPGVSSLRYYVTLDENRALTPFEATNAFQALTRVS